MNEIEEIAQEYSKLQYRMHELLIDARWS